MKVGLTGGIGSGKSTVAALLAEHGAVVVDADLLAREAVAPGSPGLAEVVDAFGGQVLDRDGSLDRAALARVVFSDPERLATLNRIVHPRVAVGTEALVAAAPPGTVVVVDVPLLVENGLEAAYDVVVVVDVPEHLQLERLLRHRGMDPQDAQARIRAQATREQRLAVADEVVDNSGDEAQLRARVAALWDRLRAAARRS